MNQCINTGIYPENMKTAKVIPLHKKDELTNIENYRPISLLPALSKILEKVIFNQLNYYFNSNNIFCGSQYGFRAKHSTELAALHQVDDITNQMDKGTIPINIYLDLSKAFDTLDHTILLHKLHYYGIGDIELKLFRDYLSNRKQFVQIGKTASNFRNIQTGVPQGSILGPLLFIIYINDIISASTYFKILIYADDTTLSKNFTPDKFKDIHQLNQAINSEIRNITAWLKVNKLSLNVIKSQFMVFQKTTRNLNSLLLSIDNIPPKETDSFTFLGISVQNHLQWNTHINNIACKISKTLGIMNRLKLYVPPYTLRTIHYSLILPHVTYGILLWGHNTERIFKLQKRAVRIMTLSKYLSHTEPLFRTLNLLNLDDLHKLNQFKFIYRLQNNILPIYFKSISMTHLCDIHHHNTRNKHVLVLPKVKYDFAKKSIRYTIPELINESPSIIIDKI